MRPLASSRQRAEALRVLSDWRAGQPGVRKLQRRALADNTPVCVIASGMSKVTVLDALLTPEAAAEAISMVESKNSGAV